MLTLNGYKVPKATVPVEQLRKTLTVKPYVPKVFVSNPNSVPRYRVYKEVEDSLYLPKHFGLEQYGPPTESTRNVPETPADHWVFAGSLREAQRPVVDAFLKPTPHDGILSLHTGGGKTVCALYIASQLRLPTLVIVHNSFLRDQWIERIKQYLPNARIGLQNDDASSDTFIGDFVLRVEEGTMKYKCPSTPNFKLVRNMKPDEITALAGILKVDATIDSIQAALPEYTTQRDIVIGMLQAIVQPKVSVQQFKPIGLVIVDECHHIASEVFVQALPKVTSKYMLGLSATPNRKDGLMHVAHWFLGPLLYTSDTGDKEDPGVQVEVYEYKNEDPVFNEILYNAQGVMFTSLMINKLAECEDRTRWLVEILKDVLEESPHRQVLVLTDRVQHTKDLYAALPPTLQSSSAILSQAISAAKRTEFCGSCSVLLATYAMCKEGFDVPTLNTLLMATPRPDVDQIVGRILRVEKSARTVPPLILDVVDPQFRRQFQERNALYKKRSYAVTKMELPPSSGSGTA
jgi:superfamily II DNA or RNA helicase